MACASGMYSAAERTFEGLAPTDRRTSSVGDRPLGSDRMLSGYGGADRVLLMRWPPCCCAL